MIIKCSAYVWLYKKERAVGIISINHTMAASIAWTLKAFQFEMLIQYPIKYNTFCHFFFKFQSICDIKCGQFRVRIRYESVKTWNNNLLNSINKYESINMDLIKFISLPSNFNIISICVCVCVWQVLLNAKLEIFELFLKYSCVAFNSMRQVKIRNDQNRSDID